MFFQSKSKECISAGIVLAESSSVHKLRRLITEIVGADLRREALQAHMYQQTESISAEGVKANCMPSSRFQARFVSAENTLARLCSGSRRFDPDRAGPGTARHRAARFWQDIAGAGRNPGPEGQRGALRLCCSRTEVAPTPLFPAMLSRACTTHGTMK